MTATSSTATYMGFCVIHPVKQCSIYYSSMGTCMDPALSNTAYSRIPFYCMLMFLWVMLWGKELLVFTDPWTNLAMLDRSFLEIPEGTVCWIMLLSSWLSIWLCQRPLRGITEVIWTELSRNQTYMCGINLRNRDFHYFVICGYKSLSLSPSKIIFKDSALFWVEKLCQIG